MVGKRRIDSFIARVGIPVAYHITRLYLRFVRLTVINEDGPVKHMEAGGKVIVALWHQRLFGVINYAERFSRFSPSAIVSKSRDGELIAQVVERLGFRPVRGSSSRGGREALTAMAKDLAENPCAIHAVDGPRGPKGVVKAGLIRMAQLAQATIFPVYISAERAWVLESWDRFLIPKPFGGVRVRWGDPIVVPERLDEKTFEALRVTVEDALIQGHARDDLAWGWERPL